MSSASNFGTSRCTLCEAGSSPSVKVVLTFELLSDAETSWTVEYSHGTYLRFRVRGYLWPQHLQTFAQQLRRLVEAQDQEAVLYDLDESLEFAVRCDDRGRGLLSVSHSHLMTCGDNLPATRSRVTIENLRLEDAGIRKLYEWVRDWTRML